MQRCLEIWDSVPIAAIHLSAHLCHERDQYYDACVCYQFFSIQGASGTKHFIDNILLQELGVTPPLGFWDPLGFSKFETPAVGWVDMAGVGGLVTHREIAGESGCRPVI